MQSVIINHNQAGQRLDKFLHKYLPCAGNGFLYKMLRKKNITLNGKKAEGKEILTLDDEVCLFFSQETFAKLSGRSADISGETLQCRQSASSRQLSLGEEGRRAFQMLRGIEVLYEDENVLILDKPVGVLTQKAQTQDISLNEWLSGYLLSRHAIREEELSYFRPAVCNRLDRNTSGIVLCGKSLAGLQYLNSCVRERTVRKFYRTICKGVISQPAVIEGILLKDQEKNLVSVQESACGRRGAVIRTAYTPLAAGIGYTLLEVELITGKPHQIRAHLASIGHPLAGDFKYGDKRFNQMLKEKYRLDHQLLHACRIEFPEDASDVGKALSKRTVNAPCPEEFVRLKKELMNL